MQKIIYYCDRCGVEIKEPYKIIGHKIDKDTGDYLTDEGGHLDYCRDCFISIMSGITDNISKDEEEGEDEDDETCGLPFEAPVEDQEEQPTVNNRQKADLDVGKMKALRNAGWTFKQIGEELGCAQSTVINRLKKEGIK
jgi:hypothetical protein